MILAMNILGGAILMPKKKKKILHILDFHGDQTAHKIAITNCS